MQSAPERGKHAERSPAHGLVHGRSHSVSQGGRASNSWLSDSAWPLAIRNHLPSPNRVPGLRRRASTFTLPLYY